FAETIRSSGDALMAILNDILDFSKIEAGRLTFETLEFPLDETVEDAVRLLAPQAQNKGIELGTLIHEDVPNQLRGDPGRLRQVLTNLIGNAVKFSEKGNVLVEVLLESALETEVILRFRVVDQGIGIPPDVQAKLFSPFV